MSSENFFKTGEPGSQESFSSLYVVTPSDEDDLPIIPRGLILSESGDVKMDMVGGGAAITVTLPAGYNPIRPKKIYATGTGAMTIVAGY